MKKILYMTNYPSPYRVAFFNELGKNSELTVLFEEKIEEQTHRDQGWFDTNYSNFKAVFLKKIKLKGTVISFDVFKYLNDKSFDIIIVGIYSTLTSQLAIRYMNRSNIKYVIETDGGYAKSGKGIKELLKRKSLSSACLYFSPSLVSDEYLKFYGASSDKILRYPFSSLRNSDLLKEPVTVEEKNEIKKRLGITEKFTIITVGQFIYRKANEVLIEAAMKLPSDIGVYIIGGEPPEFYKKLIDCNHEMSVHLLDFKNKSVLFDYYKSADIFVFPTREDIWGLVINEAMACGLPIISTNRSIAALELIDENINGFLIEPDDPQAIVDKIILLENDINLRKKMSLENIRKIKNYTIEQMAKIHLEELERF